MIEVITTGFVLGLISSFHCVGMCGPLALSLPVHHLAPIQRNSAILLYNAGRVLTYSSLGVLFGFAGRRFQIAGIQQWVSICAGIIIAILLMVHIIGKSKAHPVWLNRYYSIISSLIQRFLKTRSVGGFFIIGVGNGLLPCGMVYLAVAGALNTTGIVEGASFMFSFGMGTLPAMIALSLFHFRVSMTARISMKKAIPFVMAGMAILLILRGMNLGIPFVSPLLNSSVPEAASCH